MVGAVERHDALRLGGSCRAAGRHRQEAWRSRLIPMKVKVLLGMSVFRFARWLASWPRIPFAPTLENGPIEGRKGSVKSNDTRVVILTDLKQRG